MVIHIVYYMNFDGVSEFHSAHSTEQKAIDRINCFAASDQPSFYVEQYTLDID